MIRISDLSFPLDYTKDDLFRTVVRLLRVDLSHVRGITTIRRAVDARRRDNVHVNLTVDVE